MLSRLGPHPIPQPATIKSLPRASQIMKDTQAHGNRVEEGLPPSLHPEGKGPCDVLENRALPASLLPLVALLGLTRHHQERSAVGCEPDLSLTCLSRLRMTLSRPEAR